MRLKKKAKSWKSKSADTTMDEQEAMAANNNESNSGNCINDAEGSQAVENVSSKMERNERAKLDDGFFEIEAVRHKRVRKGEVQYLIKWREWPETANTWEPLHNLQSCTVLINAFEDSLLSGKQQRKRKGMHRDGNTQSQSKTKQQSSSAPVLQRKRGRTLVSANGLIIMDHAAPQSTSSAPVGPSNGGIEGSEFASSSYDERREDDGHSVKLDILPSVTEQNGNEYPANKNGILDTNGAKPAACARPIGSGRRKPKLVKRFKKDPAANQPDVNINAGGTQERRGPVTPQSVLPGRRNGDTENALTITEIIRPISFRVSVLNHDQDVDVIFMARRSDGAEIIVTNKYLKDHNPLMLIDFYERHLKYSPSISLS